jgi:hypothetical protein
VAGSFEIDDDVASSVGAMIGDGAFDLDAAWASSSGDEAARCETAISEVGWLISLVRASASVSASGAGMGSLAAWWEAVVSKDGELVSPVVTPAGVPASGAGLVSALICGDGAS